MLEPGWVFLALLAGLGFYVISVYNRLISLKNAFKNAFSQIDVQLQRRYELIPNLVESVKAYLKHEQVTLTKVIQARNEAQTRARAAAAQPDNASLVHALADAESQLGQAMARLSVVVEDYPDLKADQSVRDLFDQLVETDNRVSYARQAYSDSVMVYNTTREQFPANLLASLFLFREADLFRVKSDEIREAVKVSFA